MFHLKLPSNSEKLLQTWEVHLMLMKAICSQQGQSFTLGFCSGEQVMTDWNKSFAHFPELSAISYGGDRHRIHLFGLLGWDLDGADFAL